MERPNEYTTLPRMVLASSERFQMNTALINPIGENEREIIIEGGERFADSWN